MTRIPHETRTINIVTAYLLQLAVMRSVRLKHLCSSIHFGANIRADVAVFLFYSSNLILWIEQYIPIADEIFSTRRVCDRTVFQDFRIRLRRKQRKTKCVEEILMASNWKPTKRSFLFLVVITPERFTRGTNKWNTDDVIFV